MCRSCQSSGDWSGHWRAGAFPHRTFACDGFGRIVGDGADSPIAHGGRVIGSRESGGSSTAPGVVSVACKHLGGSGHCKWPSARVSGRREGAKAGTRRCPDFAFTGCVWDGHWGRWVGADKMSSISWRLHLHARRLVGSATQRSGGPSAFRPSSRRPTKSGVALERAIAPPSRAGVRFGSRAQATPEKAGAHDPAQKKYSRVACGGGRCDMRQRGGRARAASELGRAGT